MECPRKTLLQLLLYVLVRTLYPEQWGARLANSMGYEPGGSRESRRQVINFFQKKATSLLT